MMRKIKSRWLLLATAGAFVATLGFAGDQSRASAEETVCIGMNGPLSGPSAGWALPGLTGLQLIIDEVNSAGGVKADGKMNMLELHSFDNEYVPSKALQGAKELVLEHDCKQILGIGGTTADSQLPFLTQAKVFYSPLIVSDINPNRPYVLAGSDVNSRGEMIRPAYIRTAYPDKTRYAIVAQEEAGAFAGQAWEVGAAKALGFEMVYDSFYSPDTSDFAPVITAVLATNPDVVSLGLSWPDFIPLLMEQLYLQGFTGVVAANYIEHDPILQRVPADWLDKVRAIDSYQLFDDPWWGEPSAQHAFYAKWEARYGDGGSDDLDRPMNGIDWLYAPMLEVYLQGVEQAGTFDADKVLTAIRSMDHVQTIQGPAKITGEDLWGEKNMMSPPVPTTAFNADCNCKRVLSVTDWDTWFEGLKDEIIAEVRRRGQMWDQRQ
jgi:branched-chain amino acid transport system substrate-binding protein